MRVVYPEYEKGALEKVFSRLPGKEQKIINEFISYCSIGAGERKLKDIRRSIIQIRDTLEKPLDNLTLKDIREYLALLNQSNREKWTTNGIKIYLKRFLKWKYKDWSEKFEELKDIKMQRAFNEKKINSNTILKKEEIEKMMKAEPRLFWKTFFITLYESALRPIELRNLKWKDVNFDVEGDVSELSIYATKTKRARNVYVKEATYYLKKLKEEKGKDVELVFPSKMDKNEPLNKGALSLWLTVLSKKVLGRGINPYLLRHTRGTELYLNSGIPQKTAQKFMGHSKDMSDFYTHLSSKDVKDAMLKSVYNLEDLPKEKKHELEQEVETLKERMKELEKKRESSDELINELTGNPETLKMIAQAIAKLGLVGKVQSL
jgi:integrase